MIYIGKVLMDIIKEKWTGQPVYIKHKLFLWYPQVFYWRGVRVTISFFELISVIEEHRKDQFG